MLRSINPATEEVFQIYESMTPTTIEGILSACEKAYSHWRYTPIPVRAKKMERLASLFQERKKDLAILIAKEMGKPITSGIAEAEKCALACLYYAEQTESLLQPRIVATQWDKSYVTYQPIGVILGIMPWNFPLWQVIRFIAPNLMAGHGCLLKHAANVTGTALAIEQLVKEADFPENLMRTLLIESEHIAPIIAHPKIAAVTLTGSNQAGKSVAAEAGKAVKKVVLELGSNDPYLILEDANLKQAAQACVASRLGNAGQSCIAAKRLIILKSVFEPFQNLLLELIKNYQPGDPLDSNTQLGPIAREDLRAIVHTQVQTSLGKGATLLTGGVIPDMKGYYYLPTVLKGAKPGMPVFDEEVFGPVFPLIVANDEAEAIKLANHSSFGLGSAVFSQNLARAEQIAVKEIEAGNCAINTFLRSDPHLPFGGIKQSGFGRELGPEGLFAFMNIKTIILENP